MGAARLETMRSGARTDLEPDANLHEVSRSQAASLLNVSPRSVASARRVIDDGVPELVQAVERGEVAVSAAAEIASLPQEEQREALKAEAAPKAKRATKADGRAEAKKARDAKRNEPYVAPIMPVDTPAEVMSAIRPVLAAWSDEDLHESQYHLDCYKVDRIGMVDEDIVNAPVGPEPIATVAPVVDVVTPVVEVIDDQVEVIDAPSVLDSADASRQAMEAIVADDDAPATEPAAKPGKRAKKDKGRVYTAEERAAYAASAGYTVAA